MAVSTTDVLDQPHESPGRRRARHGATAAMALTLADGPSDAALVDAALGGDPDAFGAIFMRWMNPIYDVAYRIVRNRDTAAEVAQDVFLHAWNKLADLRDPAALGAWLLCSSRNRALNRIRKEQRSTPVDPQGGTEGDHAAGSSPWDRLAVAEDPLGAMADAEVAALVWESAAALGERDRSLLDLHLRHGLTPAAIAEELDVAPNAAHQMLFRLRGRLGDAVSARVLWRDGRPECDELAAELSAAGITAFDAAAVKRIGAHATTCEQCSTRRRTRLAPAVLFGSGVAAAAPISAVGQVAAGLEAAGVPLGSAGAQAIVAAAAGRTRRWRRGLVAGAAAVAVGVGALVVFGPGRSEERAERFDVATSGIRPTGGRTSGSGSAGDDALAPPAPGAASPGTVVPSSGDDVAATSTTLGAAGASGGGGSASSGAAGGTGTGAGAGGSSAAAPSGGGAGGSGGGGGVEATTTTTVPDPPYVKTVTVEVKAPCPKGGVGTVFVTYGAPAGLSGISGTWSTSDGGEHGAISFAGDVGTVVFPYDAAGLKVYASVTVTDALGRSASAVGTGTC